MANIDMKSKITTKVAAEMGALGLPAEPYLSVDTFEGNSVTFVISSGGLAAPGSVVFVLEDSDDELSWSAVGSDQMLGSINLTLQSPLNEVQSVGYVGNKRFVRVVKEISTVTVALASASAIISSLLSAPR